MMMSGNCPAFSFGPCDAEIVLHVPVGTAVDVHSSSGDIVASGVGGSLVLDTDSGDVTAIGVTGSADLRTASGDVNLRGGSGEVRAGVTVRRRERRRRRLRARQRRDPVGRREPRLPRPAADGRGQGDLGRRQRRAAGCRELRRRGRHRLGRQPDRRPHRPGARRAWSARARTPATRSSDTGTSAAERSTTGTCCPSSSPSWPRRCRPSAAPSTSRRGADRPAATRGAGPVGHAPRRDLLGPAPGRARDLRPPPGRLEGGDQRPLRPAPAPAGGRCPTARGWS